MNFSVNTEEQVVLYLQLIIFHDQTNTVLEIFVWDGFVKVSYSTVLPKKSLFGTEDSNTRRSY